MPGAEAAALVAAEWMAKAEEDFTTAAHTLRLEAKCPTGAVCFHAQQCVEKYLKAYLVLQGVGFPKVHEIEALVRLLPGELHIDLSPEEQARLTEYAVAARYPGSRAVPRGEARRAVALARRVRRQVRSVMRKPVRKFKRQS